MAVYFDYKIQSLYDEHINTHVSWHKNFPLLAVASHNQTKDTGSVSFYLDEGELVEDSNIGKTSIVTALTWHPTRKVIAIGWKSGELTTWNEHDKETHEGPLFHKSPISNIHWNGTGSRLITSDQEGVLCVWKVDQRGRLQQTPMFDHAVRSSIVQIVFKLTVGADVAADIAAAARAAVSGDESALDMFESQKSGQPRFSIGQAESIQLYFATKDGSIYFLDERGKCTKCYRVEGAVQCLLYYETREIIVTVTEALLLSQHNLKQDGEYFEISKVKLSGQTANFSVTNAGTGLIATACGERVARIIDIDNDQNFILNLDGNSAFRNDECINCLSYSPQKGILAGGTNYGHVVMWIYNPLKNEEHPWELQAPSEVHGTVADLHWGSGGLLAVNCTTDITILSQSVMNFHFNDKVAAVQMTPNHLSVETFPSAQVNDLKTDVHIKGVFCTKVHTTIWNGKKIAVYEISENKTLVRAAGSFNSDAHKVAVYEQNIYLIESEKVTVRTFQGTVKQELTFLEQEGDPIEISVCGPYLVIGTTKSVLKLYDLSRREARQISSTKHLIDTFPHFGQINHLKCNCNGTRVAFTSQNSNHMTSPFLYVWDVEHDTLQTFNFTTGCGSEDLEDDLDATQKQLTSSIKGYVPDSAFWDANEPKLLVCEATKVSMEKNEKSNFLKNSLSSSPKSTKTNTLIVTLFSSPDHGIIVQDNFNKDDTLSALLGIDIPYLYFVKSVSADIDPGLTSRKGQIIQKTLRDFVGLEQADDKIRSAMTNFSYLSAVGNMDEAFKAIKSIKSGSVWENMARMCVKTKRLDVAMVCLGNMGNAAAAKAVRECRQKEAELNAHIAMLAIQIGMYDEAEQLYQECGRYDLLCQYYQASNNWTKAIECADTHDRIHLRTTYYTYAKYLESTGNLTLATQYYERSDTNKSEVPRMLFDDEEKLMLYIHKCKDVNINKWYGQYQESIGNMEVALQYYEQSQDYLSMVRVFCFVDNLERAAEICNETGDKAACYHLARQYDSIGDIKNAIHCFSRAQSYSNAIRLAKENEMDNELMNLALLSSPEDMLDCAQYFERKDGMEDKAVMLYHKGGSASKAIDLAFKTQQFGALQLISEDLDENADPEVLRKCAEFFIEHDQFDRAVDLLVVAKRYEDALSMCLDHHVSLTEELAEKMSMSKDSQDSKHRLNLLEKIADAAYKQGSFHLATKKYTQAGNKTKAMKSLLKSGDTEKIIFFAGVSRQREIYVMAANYLQSLDWRKDANIMKGIISFYTKGRALESLSSFYESCVQVEIDEFQNYEKAFGALSEAYKCLAKAKTKNVTQQEEKLSIFKSKMTLMKKFIQAKKSYDIDPEAAVKQCEILLNDPEVADAIRVGDLYKVIIEHYANVKNYAQAYQIIQDMRQNYPSMKLQYFVSMNIIEQIHTALNIPVQEYTSKNNIANNIMDSSDVDAGEILDEEIAEEDDDDDYI